MKRLKYSLALVLFLHLASVSFGQKINISAGKWRGSLIRKDEISIPFVFDIETKQSGIVMNIINAEDTVYIAHDILDLIREFKTTRAKDENIKVKLKGFKNAYQLENNVESSNKVSIEHYYDVMKRKTVKREIIDKKFND